MDHAAIAAQIKGLTADSRMARRGWLFAALPGKYADGAAFVNDAVINGASFVLAKPGTVIKGDAQLIESDNPRADFPLIAAAFYKLQPQVVCAVTGTNGKTSTVSFTRQIWESLGRQSASLGTLGIRTRAGIKAGSMTTPDPVTLHAELADLAASGVTHLAMEASSHGLHQHRLDGVRLAAAAFTNLSRDHLDYHQTMDAYRAAKARLLFDLLPKGNKAVINADDDAGAWLLDNCAQKNIPVIDFGHAAKTLKLVSQTPQPVGQTLVVQADGQNHTVNLPLAGLFQGMNALCAAGLVLASDESLKFADLVPHLESLAMVPGRLQAVTGHKGGAAVYVDYAHSPHGLETVLKALRPHTAGRLVCVFGAGGDRDKGKRPLMGAVVAELADIAIITDDNPRTEDAATIRAEISAACPDATVIGDRRAAISYAIGLLQAGDVLVIAGKGHEQGQTIGDIVHPFDDVGVAAQILGDQ